MSRLLTSTPADDGFRMPGEFEPHRGTWLLWPERPDNWRQGGKPAQRAFAAVARAIAESESVTVGVSASQWVHCRSSLPDHVRVLEMSNDDAWIRDCGPTFVVDDHGQMRAVDWRFNAWGGLEGGAYFPWDQDDLVARKVAEIEAVDRYRAPFVLEGGSIHSDGEGTVLTTEECLLNPNRNPALSKRDIEAHLVEYLGAETVLWLGRGVFADETSGHVDNLVSFVAPGAVLLTWTEDRGDPQHEISIDARRRLETAVDAKGRSLEVHLLPMPGPSFIRADEAQDIDPIEGTNPRREGDRLAASYVNAYVATTRVVVPLLDPRVDEIALDTYGRVFPGREIVGVEAREILLGGGNIHCITQQVPLAGRAA